MSEEIMDLSNTIQAKSDQLNAVDILGGPITITITKVVSKAGNDQPTSIYYEGDEGKPYKPCLGMRRILVDLWGRCNPKGRMLTLFCEPTVTYSGKSVGGIEISHMSNITKEYKKPVRLNGSAVKMVTIKPIAQAVKKELTAELAEQLSAEITNAETMPELSKVAAKIKAGNYEQSDVKKELLAKYSSAKDEICNN